MVSLAYHKDGKHGKKDSWLCANVSNMFPPATLQLAKIDHFELDYLLFIYINARIVKMIIINITS